MPSRISAYAVQKAPAQSCAAASQSMNILTRSLA
jgi:hypothetical protein